MLTSGSGIVRTSAGLSGERVEPAEVVPERSDSPQAIRAVGGHLSADHVRIVGIEQVIEVLPRIELSYVRHPHGVVEVGAIEVPVNHRLVARVIEVEAFRASRRAM